MNSVMEWIGKFFGQIDVSGVEAVSIKALQALLIFLIAYICSKKLQKFIDKSLTHTGNKDDDVIATYKSVARALIWISAVFIAIHVMGINMKPLFAAGGVMALALAFAFKNIAENLISGMMIRFERVIKPGDIVETEGSMIRIKKIGLRNTIARTKDEKDLLIPNSHLVQQKVANFTYRDSVCRVQTLIGVSYDTDLHRVREALETTCDKIEGKSDKHPPVVSLFEFNDSQVTYKISVWIEDPWVSNSYKSKLHEAIWKGLKEANIKMAYPQLDIHFDKGSQAI